MKISKEALKQGAAKSLNAVAIISGTGAVGFGVWQIHEPAAFIVVGLLVLWMGLPDK